ncbi:beta-ketoacyl synthase [Virgibacillus dokdonensis]|uniref:Beta-ketoacyl synthase n=1 Tax=Virgibacillus dokdonensis TaxID=302167 RepID=A0A3E0WJ41_9BACI|nr:beta-ketoacyl-[acyl-carrier-protein] synthase family protein [Virgibacillus dokdonensis]RFA32964.1 beta-ketoacyl synthase [Virgibacillus dokdonensis]
MEVAVTGIGVLSSIGNDREEFWNSLLEGKVGLRKMKQYDSSNLITDFAGEVQGFDPSEKLSESEKKQTERCAQLSYFAASEALKQAKLPADFYNHSKKGVVIGTSLGGMLNGEEFHRQWIRNGLDSTDKDLLLSYPIHTSADFLSKCFLLKGPKITISTACAAGSNAIGYGADLIRNGKADMMLVGGADPLSLLSLSGFNSLKAMSNEPCSPYSESKGITLAEGAGFLVVERLDKALERGAEILALIKGYGLSSDAYHPTAPNPGGKGAYQSMQSALNHSNVPAEKIGYINGHGTGTPANDTAESIAIKNLFRTYANQIPISSTKSMIGHTLGAAGAIEGITSILALKNQVLPPTANYNEGRNRFGMDFVPNHSRKHHFNTVLSNSFAFGGNNASVVFERFNSSHQKSIEDQQEEKTERVVVTGFGTVEPLGVGKEELWDSLQNNRNSLEEMPYTENQYNAIVGAIPSERSYRKLINPMVLRRLDLLGKLGMASTKLAMDHSNLKITRYNNQRIGVIFGTSSGPLETVEKVNRSIIEHGPEKTKPGLFPNTVMNAAAGHICLNYQIKGPTTTICSGGVAGSQALIYGYQLIQNGILDVAIIVAADEYHEVIHAGYDRSNVLGNDPSPFSRNSKGFALSGGSTTIVLESESHALSHDKNILAEIKGYGMTSDAHSIAGNKANGRDYSIAIKKALADSQLSWSEIDGIYTDARGLPIADLCEANAILKAGGENTPVTTLAHKNGYSVGGLSVLHIASSIYSMETNRLPKLDVQEPVANLNYSMGDVTLDKAENFLINSSAFGGGYTSVVLGRYA